MLFPTFLWDKIFYYQWSLKFKSIYCYDKGFHSYQIFENYKLLSDNQRFLYRFFVKNIDFYDVASRNPHGFITHYKLPFIYDSRTQLLTDNNGITINKDLEDAATDLILEYNLNYISKIPDNEILYLLELSNNLKKLLAITSKYGDTFNCEYFLYNLEGELIIVLD